uniref:Carbohydrate kinase FGGY C-terminal domain-containing protein n=1 Tax=Eptatretus burgeri TaxID=7764 RepID=A0A8C4PYN5_EPTBU
MYYRVSAVVPNVLQGVGCGAKCIISCIAGLFSDVAETADIANSVPDTDGVYFVPSFSGIQLPVNDPSACTAMFGLRPSTTPAHIVRAILESLIFRNKQLLDSMETETGIAVSNIRVDGGVSNNTFVVQQTADVLGKPVHRPKYTNMSCQGAAFMAGLVVGFWTDRSQLVAMCGKHQKFLPRKGQLSTMDTFHRWEKAVERTRGWYN